jgi:hypothetical protein
VSHPRHQAANGEHQLVRTIWGHQFPPKVFELRRVVLVLRRVRAVISVERARTSPGLARRPRTRSAAIRRATIRIISRKMSRTSAAAGHSSAAGGVSFGFSTVMSVPPEKKPAGRPQHGVPARRENSSIDVLF